MFQSRDRSRCLAITFIKYIMIELTHFHVFYHVEERKRGSPDEMGKKKSHKRAQVKAQRKVD